MVIKFSGLAQNDVLSTIDGFKFGGMVRYCHSHMHTVEILVDYNLAVERYTTKWPN